VEAWFNGVKKVSLTNIQLRGNVSAATARVDAVSLQTFYGGSTSAWAPSRNTHSRFSGFVVRTDLPDFSKPFDPNPTGLEKPIRSGNRSGETHGSITLTYLGNGEMPKLLPGMDGQRLSLSDLQGRRMGDLQWNGNGAKWEGWSTGNAPSRPCVLIAMMEDREASR
jgi:hypothetical protein